MCGQTAFLNDMLAGLFAVLFLPAAHVAVAQTSPSVTSITPVSNVLNVAANSNITVMFDQAILPATSNPSLPLGYTAPRGRVMRGGS